MKTVLLAAAASLVIAFAAHAADAPRRGEIVKAPPATSCDGPGGLMHRMSFQAVGDMPSDPPLCPQSLSTMMMRLPRLQPRT